MDDNNSEIRKIRIELQWISWGLVKVPLIALGLFAIYSLLNRSGGDVEEANSGVQNSLERVCKKTADGRLAIEVGNRTLFLDNVPIYEQLSAEEKWQFWDADESGVASEEEIEAGILKLQNHESD